MSKIAKALQKATAQRDAQEGTSPYAFEKKAVEQSLQLTPPVYCQTTVQAATPQMSGERLIGSGNENAGLVNAITVLRTQLLQKTRKENWNTILVTSPNAGAGKTTVAINLSISLAHEMNQTALLVDLNLRAPAVSHMLGLGERPGIYDYLTKDVPLEQLLVNPGLAKLVVLPAGAPSDRVADLLGAPQLRSLIAELKNRYPERYVIIDAPHVVGLPDVLVCAEYVDAILMVASESETQEEELSQALSLVEERNVLGVVLNKAR